MTYQTKHQKTQRGTFWKHVFTVMVAGSASKTFVAPLERMKLLLQIRPLLNLDANQ